MKLFKRHKNASSDELSPTSPKPDGWMADTNDLPQSMQYTPSTPPKDAGILPALETSDESSGEMGEGVIFSTSEILDFAEGTDSYS